MSRIRVRIRGDAACAGSGDASSWNAQPRRPIRDERCDVEAGRRRARRRIRAQQS